MTDSAIQISLLAADGPTPVDFSINRDRPCSIGRLKESDLCLLHENVSRQHAQVLYRGGTWFVVDLDSKWGTFLNGVRLTKHKPSSLAGGDLLRIGPWTLRVLGLPSTTSLFQLGKHTTTADDPTVTGQRVERAASMQHAWRADRRLKLVLECMSRLADETDEIKLATTAMELLITGSGYARGAILRRLDEGTQVEVVVCGPAPEKPSKTGEKPASAPLSSGQGTEPLANPPTFDISRSLLKEASLGETAVLTSAAPFVASQSMAEMRIHSAICVPLSIGGTVVAFIYLDARGTESRVQGDAELFCEAVGAAYSLALANINRVELERRERMLAAELSAARVVQEKLLPSLNGSIGPFLYAARLHPGLFVAGDLLDLFTLQDGTSALLIGDVSGRGAAAGMHMAMVQAFIHSELTRGSQLAAAVSAVNRFMAKRLPPDKFVSLWIGVCQPCGALHYVDAGHGHWMIRRRDGQVLHAVDERWEGGLPLGVEASYDYKPAAADLARGDTLILYSDGLVEQRCAAGTQFSRRRLAAVFERSQTPKQWVDSCFQTVLQHSSGLDLDDDSTLAVLTFE